MKKYFLKLYEYNKWANQRVLDGLKKQNVSEKEILKIMSHTISALFIWLSRIEKKSPAAYPLWETYTLDELITMNEEITQRWMHFVQAQDSFDWKMSYNNYVGDPYTNNVEQIMIHLVNHSSYHRAQVALLLRQNGMEPTNTGFITYDRVITGQWKE